MRFKIISAQVVLLAMLMFFSAGSYASEDSYESAKEKAFADDWQSAKEICLNILSKCEDCHETRVLLGRILSWENNYEGARIELNKALSVKPEYDDARLALIDVEIWSGNYEEAVSQGKAGTAVSPSNNEFLYKTAIANERNKNYAAAEENVHQLLKKDPGHVGGHALLSKIKHEKADESLSIGYSQESFSEVLADRHFMETEWGKKYKTGALIIRMTLGDTTEQSGEQYELEFYPKITERTYAYISGGFSEDEMFPSGRAGVEIYHSFSKGYEGSAGFRYMNFAEENARIYTASVGKYIGDYLITPRMYYSNKDYGKNMAENITVRRYNGDSERYWTLTAGTGSSGYESVTGQAKYSLGSRQISFDKQWEIKPLIYLKLLFGYENEEYLPGRKRDVYSFNVKLKRLY